jgi:hypothetical protein
VISLSCLWSQILIVGMCSFCLRLLHSTTIDALRRIRNSINGGEWTPIETEMDRLRKGPWPLPAPDWPRGCERHIYSSSTQTDTNNEVDHVVLEAMSSALESAGQMMNTSVNNFTNLPSRNIGSGLGSPLQRLLSG